MSDLDIVLKLKRGYIVYMMGFSLPINYGICRDQSIQKLRSKGLNADWTPSDSKNFAVAERFLLPQFIEESFRIKLDDFVVRLARNSDMGLREILIPVSTYLTIYPKLNAGILLLSLKIEDLTT